MKKCIKPTLVAGLSILLLLLLSVSAGAATYEPDGGSDTEYLFPDSECNRTLVVRCVDEAGSLIKTVTYFTKRGEDALVTLGLYGYDIIGFDSDQGLWETCKLTWTSGTSLCTNAHIQIRYYFRTGGRGTECAAGKRVHCHRAAGRRRLVCGQPACIR